jgi:hypothetical protein
MAYKFLSRDRDPLSLSNEDYGRIVSYYDITDFSSARVVQLLQLKYETGELQRTVESLRRY